MKILYVSRSNTGTPHPFIKEQADVLIRNHDVTIQHFLIASGGIKGYTRAILNLFKFTRSNEIDIIHVHYGLSALAVVLNKLLFFKKYKIIITFHGSDLNKRSERRLSLLASRFSSHNILVSGKMLDFIKCNHSVIPCGIDTNIELNFRDSTRIKKGWGKNDFIILFSSRFDRKVKDPTFAFKVLEAFSISTSKNVNLIELKGYSRYELTCLMQAADAMIMCSHSEGSPQVIKEAILNTLPVVSNDVGDVRDICSGVDNCFIVPKEVNEFVKSLSFLSTLELRIQDRTPVLTKFDNNIISNKLFNIYKDVLNKPKKLIDSDEYHQVLKQCS